jgi:hypothetical protein
MKPFSVVKRSVCAVINRKRSRWEGVNVYGYNGKSLDLRRPYMRSFVASMEEWAHPEGITCNIYEFGCNVNDGKDAVDFSTGVLESDLFDEVYHDSTVSIARRLEVVFVSKLKVVVDFAVTHEFAAVVEDEGLVSFGS